jgi:hypothetical protein
LKLLDFLNAEKRIYAKLTPLTPKIQAHDRVTEIGTCQKAGADFFMLSGSMVIAQSMIEQDQSHSKNI